MKLELESKSRWINRHAGPVDGFDTMEQAQAAAQVRVRRFLSHHDALAGQQLQLDTLVGGASTLLPLRVSGPPLAGQTLFAKVAVNAQQRAALAEETQSAALAAKIGVAPPMLARHPDLMLTAFVEARPLSASDLANDAIMYQALSALARLHAAGETHTLPPRCALDPQKRIRISLSQAKRLGRITHGESAFITNETEKNSQALARMPNRPRVFTHGDFQNRNILVGDKGLWLIDFEDAGVGEPMTDLAHLAAENFLPLDALPRFASLYCRASAAPYDETLTALQLCFHTYSLWRLLSRIKRETDEERLQVRFQEAYDRAAWLDKNVSFDQAPRAIYIAHGDPTDGAPSRPATAQPFHTRRACDRGKG